MNPLAVHIAAVLLAYMIGSFPTAYLIGKARHGVDLREEGSKNLGATNTFRVLGWQSGTLVLLVDVLKGWGVVQTSFALEVLSVEGYFIHFSIGLAAVLGHIFPIYMSFKGGKGVATVLGVVIAVHPWAALSCIGIFLLLFLLTRYVSLGSILAACTFPVLVIFVFKSEDPFLIHFSWVLALLIVFTHHKNIDRLLKKKENKLHFSTAREDQEEDENA